MFHRKRRKPPVFNNPRFQPHQPQKSKIIYLLPHLFSIFILGGFLYFLANGFFRVSQITCSQDNQACSSELTQYLSQYQRNLIFFLKPAQITQEISALNPIYNQVVVHTTLPHSLDIKIITTSNQIPISLYILNSDNSISTPTPFLELSPSASPSSESATPTPNSPHWLFSEISLLDNLSFEAKNLSSDGHISEPLSDSTPVFSLISSSSLDPYFLSQSYYLYQEIYESGLNPSLLLIKDFHAIALIKETYIIFDITQDPRQSVNRYHQLKTGSTINLNHAIIDLRFNKPVVSDY